MTEASGIFPIAGGKGYSGQIDSYIYAIKQCPNLADIHTFVDCCIGGGNITVPVRTYIGRFEHYEAYDLDPVTAVLYKGLSRYNNEVINRALNEELRISEENFREIRSKLLKKRAEEIEEEFGVVEAAALALILKVYSYDGYGKAASKDKMEYNDKIFTRLGNLRLIDGIHVGNKDVIQLLKDDAGDSDRVEHGFYFLDPPYLGAKVGYYGSQRSTSENFHKELCKLALKFNNILICGYESELYKEILERNGFYKTCIGEKSVTCGAKSASGSCVRNREFIWTSYKI